MQMTVETSKGTIVIQLDPAGAPNTIENLRSKADSGFLQRPDLPPRRGLGDAGRRPHRLRRGGGKIASEYNHTPFRTGRGRHRPRAGPQP